MNDIERRHLDLELTELRVEDRDDGPTQLTGYAAVFGKRAELGSFTEEIAPGAFKGALKDSDTRVLFNHDPNHLLGRTSKGTAKLEEDKRGLAFTVDLPDTASGRDVGTLVKRGDLDGNSFSFTVEKEEWDESGDTPHRTIRSVSKLFDVGPVTFPAYKDTVVSARADARMAELEARREDEARERQQRRIEQERLYIEAVSD